MDPTVAKKLRLAELDACFDDSAFLRHVREERKFPSPEALKTQILLDVRRAQTFFRRTSRGPGGNQRDRESVTRASRACHFAPLERAGKCIGESGFRLALENSRQCDLLRIKFSDERGAVVRRSRDRQAGPNCCRNDRVGARNDERARARTGRRTLRLASRRMQPPPPRTPR